MILSEAVALYVTCRRSQGSPFTSTESTLRAFCRSCDDLALAEVTSEHVTRFCNRSECAPTTRLSRFSAVKCFLEYFACRSYAPRLILCRPAQPLKRRVPFIYTHSQVKALLASTVECRGSRCGFSGETFHLFLLFLYATGATVSEALGLRRCDIGPKHNQIRLGLQGGVIRSRELPVPTELIRRLRRYKDRSPGRFSAEAPLFTDRQGKPLKRMSVVGRFTKLLKITGTPDSTDGKAGRMQDLRFTFAVHRLDAWIKSGSNLHEMLPALSAYMGYSSLMKAEQFLDFAPERFRLDLEKLSPSTSGPEWSANASLMRFLRQL